MDSIYENNFKSRFKKSRGKNKYRFLKTEGTFQNKILTMTNGLNQCSGASKVEKLRVPTIISKLKLG